MTPREFRATLERVRAEDRRWDGRFGLLCALIANVNRDAKRHPSPYRPSDFFPSLSERPSVVTSSSGPSDEQIMAGLIGWAALCGTKLN